MPSSYERGSARSRSRLGTRRQRNFLLLQKECQTCEWPQHKGYSMRYRAMASSFQLTPLPGTSGGVTMPFTTRNGSAKIGAAQSTYSSQCAVGLTASRAALTSGKRCDDSGILAPVASE